MPPNNTTFSSIETEHATMITLWQTLSAKSYCTIYHTFTEFLTKAVTSYQSCFITSLRFQFPSFFTVPKLGLRFGEGVGGGGLRRADGVKEALFSEFLR